MPLMLKPGTRLFSAVCATEMIVVKAPGVPVELTIGGAVPVMAAADRGGDGKAAEGFDGGALMGKRYIDADEVIEVLCTKSGDGVPALDGVVLQLKDARAMPASD